MTARFLLDDLRVIEVTGNDRVKFLQGQLTQDIATLGDDRTRLAGWADARGRVLATLHLATRDDAILMIVAGALAETVVRRLRLFVLRDRVTLSLGDLAVGGISMAGPAEAIHRPADGVTCLGIAGDEGRAFVVGEAGAVHDFVLRRDATPSTADAWRLQDVRRGIPTVTPPVSGEFVAQMLNLDLLDGISFSKGCYVGQEIVARTHYRGRIKRRMLRFSADGNPPGPAVPISGNRGQVGQVVTAASVDDGCELLGVVYLDDLTGRLWLGDEPGRGLTLLPLPYPVPELAGLPD